MTAASLDQSETASTQHNEQTDQTATMPASTTSGNLLVWAQAVDGNSTTVLTKHADWTQIFNFKRSTNNNILAVFVKQATGSDGATVISTTNENQRSVSVIFELTAAEVLATQAPEAATAAEGSSTAADAGEVTPTDGPKDFLYIALAGLDRGDSTVTGFPTGYDVTTGVEADTDHAAGGATIGWAIKTTIASSSDDPSAFTNSDDPWVATTVAIHPGAAGVVITDVDGDEQWNDGDAGLVITGTGFV